MQQSCSSLNASHSSFVRPRKTSATSRQPSEPGRRELVLDQVLAADPAQKACQNFGSSAPQLTQPSAHS